MTNNNQERGLPTEETTAEFAPKVRWKFWLPMTVVVVGFIITYFVVERMRENTLRAKLLAEHASLTRTLSPEYQARRAKIERLVVTAVGRWEGDFHADGFTMEQLRREPVLFGRIRLSEVHRPEEVRASIRRRFEDQVGGCLGIEIERVWKFYDRGEFLMPAYVDALRPTTGTDRLRFLREDLLTRLRVDTPDLVQFGRRPIFGLVVDEGQSQIDGASRVYFWDMSTERLLLRARAEGNETVIIPVRISGIRGGGAPIPQPSGALTVTMHDCSVADRVKALLGVGTFEATNAPEVTAPSVTAAIAGDGGLGADASGAPTSSPATAISASVDAGQTVHD